MNCEEAEGLLARLVYDELDDDETRTRLCAHVESCAACRELAGDMRVAAKLLKQGIELETPVLPPVRKMKLFREARRARFGFGADFRRFGSAAKRVFVKRGFVAAAAAVLIFGLGLVFVMGTVGGLKGSPAPYDLAGTIVCMEVVPAEDYESGWVGGGPTLGIRAPAAPSPAAEPESSGFVAGAHRELFERERKIDMPDELEHPVFVHEEVEVSDHMETANTIVTDRNAAWWRFEDDAKKTAADSTANGNAVTLAGEGGDAFFGGAPYAPGKAVPRVSHMAFMDANSTWDKDDVKAPAKPGGEYALEDVAFKQYTTMLHADRTAKAPDVRVTTKENLAGEVTLRIYDTRDITGKVASFPGPELTVTDYLKGKREGRAKAPASSSRPDTTAVVWSDRTSAEDAGGVYLGDAPATPRPSVMGKGGRLATRRVSKKGGGIALDAVTNEPDAGQTLEQQVVTRMRLRDGETGGIAGLRADQGQMYQRQHSGTYVTEDTYNVNAARGQADAISDIPLGGMGIVGNLGVGGGGAGAVQGRAGGRRELAKAREAIRKSRTVSRDADLKELEAGVRAMRDLPEGLPKEGWGNQGSEIRRALEVKKEYLARRNADEINGRTLGADVYSAWRYHADADEDGDKPAPARDGLGRVSRRADRRELEAAVQAMRKHGDHVDDADVGQYSRHVQRALKLHDELARPRSGEAPVDEAGKRLYGLIRDDNEARSRSFGEVGERHTDARQYVKARAALQRAVQLDPTNKAAADKLAQVNDALGVRMPAVRTSLDQLRSERVVMVQESLVNLEQLQRGAEHALARASGGVAGGGAGRTREMALAERVREAGRAIERAERAREIMKWMPADVDVSKHRARAGKIVTEAREKQTKALAELRDEKKMHGMRTRIETKDKHIERMHKIALTQQKALEISKSNMRNALGDKMEMQTDANNSRHRLVASQKEIARLEKDLHHNSWVIQKMQDSGVPVQDIVFGAGDQPDVEIHAKILAVRPEINLVMVSVGTDQKVRKGYRFTVFRGDRYIGKVEVEKVFGNMASARVLAEWTKEKVNEGDDVSTMGGGGGTVKLGRAETERKRINEELQKRRAKEARAKQVQAAKRKRDEIARKRREEEARRKKQDEERRRKEEEARRRKEEEERKRIEEEEAREAERIEADLNAPPPPVNPFVLTARDRFSTFAMDVDTAAYTIARKHVRAGALPPRRTVRMEEFVNAFDYNYPTQARNVFNIFVDGAPAPFGRGLALVKIGVQAKVLGREGRKPAHLVFVVDASGSMDRPDRLPLVKQAIGMLVGALGARDRVSLVVFGLEERIVIEGVPATERATMLGAVGAIQAGGYTNMFEGLARGYEVAARQFRSGEINRVILCSDGVANVGVAEPERMLELTKRFRKRGIEIVPASNASPDTNAGERFVTGLVDTFRGQGVTLTTAGFGAGSYDDDMLERLANSGDGAYVFIDSPAEARRVFVEQMAATLQTVAKDAKIQVEFAPSRVRRYRLIGYENRDVADKDFRNDAIDAGEVGSGQAVTALYEIELERPSDRGADLGTVYVRYQNTDTGKVEEISTRIRSSVLAPKSPDEHPRLFLAACAAETAEILRGSEHAAGGTLDAVERVMVAVANALPLDTTAAELLRLVHAAKSLRGER